MHENSMEAWRAFDSKGRKHQVCEALSQAKRTVTDREVATKLGSEDMNYVRPVITGLITEGWILEVGSVSCPTTNHTVRRIRLATDEEREAHQPGTQKCEHARLWRELCTLLGVDPCKTSPETVANAVTCRAGEGGNQ